MQQIKYKHSDLTGKVIGCAMKVHKYFGSGFQEIVYQRSMVIELENAGISLQSEVERPVFYYNELVGRRRIDIIADEKVLIELKAIAELDALSINQILNCLRVFNYEIGLLFNFGSNSLQFKRFIMTPKNSTDLPPIV